MPGSSSATATACRSRPDDPVVSLDEGSTPLVLAPRLSERAGAEVWLKLEGANPTGSFKDRGMTCAVSAAVREGAEAIVCASTGNTAASAAAYAARAGLRGAVIVPEGKIATGKLAQALMHGARVIALRGNFDEALRLVRELAGRHPIALVNSVNEFRIEGQKTAAFEIAEALDGELDALCIPVGNAGNITAYWRASPSSGCASADARLPGRRARRRSCTARRSSTRRRSRARSGSATRALGGGDGRDDRPPAERSRRSPTSRSSRPTGSSPQSEGVFCEPASAASVAGLLAHGAGGAAARRLRAHRPRAQGPADRARAGRRGGPVRPGARARSSGRCSDDAAAAGGWSGCRPPRPTWARASTCSRRRWRCTSSSRWWRPARSRCRPTSTSRATATNLVVRAFERLHPADGFEFRISLGDPAVSGGLGSSAAAIVAGLLAADHLFELDADVRALATELEGHPDNVAAALEGGFVICDGDARAPLRAADGARGGAGRARRGRSAPAQARAALPAEVPLADAVFNVAHASMLVLGLARGDWDLIAAGLDDRLHQPYRAHLYPRSAELLERAPALGALGATISGAGPTVLVWSPLRADRRRGRGADARDARAGRR